MVNIVIFGETGAGKSSVINLMAGQQVARTSPDSGPSCTRHWTEYTIIFDSGNKYQVFDTVGLEEPSPQSKEYLSAVADIYSLINVLKEHGGIDFLLFCIRGGRVTANMQSNYRLFFEFLCQEKVPLALVVTNLEREEHMEDWYTRNVGHLEKHGIHSVGHACISAATTIDGRHRVKYEESRRIVCNVIETHCYPSVRRIGGPQETQPESYLNIDATSAGGNPYTTFFQSSRPSLASASPNISPKRRPWYLFFIPSPLRSPGARSVRLHERLKRCFFAHPTEQKLEGKVRAGDEDKEHGKEHGKDVDSSSPDDPFPPAEPDNNDNRKLSKFFKRVRSKDTTTPGKQAPGKITCDPSPEAVEAPTGSVSQADPSSHAGLVHNISSPMTSGQSSESSHPPLANERISLPQRFKHHFFSQRTGPQPVIVYAARPKKTHGMAPRTVLPANQSAEQGNGNGNGNANAQTVQSSSATVQPAAAHPDSGSNTLQSPQRQVATQTSQRDYGCWGNFCLVVGCIDRPVVC